MSSANPSAMFAESLSDFSKAAYKAEVTHSSDETCAKFTEVEAQAREDVARAVNETREAKVERDTALKNLHTGHLELAASKAALAQAEQTISHQTDTLAVQLETIAQLRRELTQCKDQSRNWQEHFLRVEQERCALSSRIDELIDEKLQYARQPMNSNTIFTPKGSNFITSTDSAPSSTTTKRPSIPSPTQPPAYRTAALPPSEEFEQSVSISAAHKSANSRAAKRSKVALKPRQQEPATDDVQEITSSASKRSRKNPPAESIHTPKSDAPLVPRQSTIIRRVHAVINVKREDSEDESPTKPSSSHEAKEESLGAVFASGSSSTKRNQASRSRVIQDESESEYDEYRSGSEEPRRLRNRSRINYEEDNYEEEEEDDELMLGADDNHEEVFGPSRDEGPPKKQAAAAAAPPKKKRKVFGR